MGIRLGCFFIFHCAVSTGFIPDSRLQPQHQTPCDR